MKRCWLLLCLFELFAATAAAASLQPAFVFQNSMMLQRSMPVPVWGTADPGAVVSVDFAQQHKSVIADKSGRWMVKLDAMPASDQPRNLRIAAETTIELHDVLVGDVWLAAGQSNMEFPLSREARAAEEIPKADLPNVRLLNLSFAGQYMYAKRFDKVILDRLTPDRFYTGEWAHCTPGSAKSFSAIGYYFVRQLNSETGIPVGIVNLSVGGSPTEAWLSRDAMAADPQLASLVLGNWLSTPPLDDWCKQRGRENLGDSPTIADPSGPNHAYKPGFLYEASIARLIPFPIRGVIWYQGESNSLDQARMLQHESLFRTLVSDWRKRWGIGNFPFLYCQLSGIGTTNYKSQFWPDFRDQQRRLLTELPNSAMAVTSDYGNKTDVHPREKREIARRLALAAMALSYDGKEEWEGPLVDSLSCKGSGLIVSFSHAASGLSTSDHQSIRSFEVAGTDGLYKTAVALSKGNSIHLTCPEVPAPNSARYDWQPFPDGNLVNGSGLPCSTFIISLSGNTHAQ